MPRLGEPIGDEKRFLGDVVAAARVGDSAADRDGDSSTLVRIGLGRFCGPDWILSDAEDESASLCTTAPDGWANAMSSSCRGGVLKVGSEATAGRGRFGSSFGDGGALGGKVGGGEAMALSLNAEGGSKGDGICMRVCDAFLDDTDFIGEPGKRVRCARARLAFSELGAGGRRLVDFSAFLGLSTHSNVDDAYTLFMSRDWSRSWVRSRRDGRKSEKEHGRTRSKAPRLNGEVEPI